MKPIVLPYDDKLPQVAADAFVAPGASLIGDVTVGPQTGVWFGAVLRGDILPIVVGARTSIQDSCVMHTSSGWAPTLVGDDCTVGHAAILHGCTVSDRVVVGMGSIVLDGAVIGPDVILGAGSLVTTDMKIPAGVLAFGRPAKVVRELREDELLSIRQGAAEYVDKHRHYREMLKAGAG